MIPTGTDVFHPETKRFGVVVHEPYPTFCQEGEVAVVFEGERKFSKVSEKELKMQYGA